MGAASPVPGPVVPAGTRRAWRAGVLRLAPTLRPLPWRRTRDPWAVLVSEVMLQQTQASRVVEPWHHFLVAFPDAASCAAAPTAAVVRAWSGLGYNRRAVQLQAAAAATVARHGGRVPGSLADLLALPGLGPYTARAVLAFAYERDVAVVDTNVRRVLARGLLGRPAPPRHLQRVADALVPPGRGWSWNQCLLDLGASVCSAQRPACGRCPVVSSCRWRGAGHPDPDPGAAAARQAPFAGSDRQGRGRLVAALCLGPVPADALARSAGWPGDPDRAVAAADRLVADGLAVRDHAGALRLPGDG